MHIGTRDKDSRTLSVQCGDQPLPPGLLIGVRPELAARASLGISVMLPDGRREIIGYIRNFEPDFATTYWLRVPLDLLPGSRMLTEFATAGDSRACSLEVTIQGPR
jgi:hypothetical protein